MEDKKPESSEFTKTFRRLISQRDYTVEDGKKHVEVLCNKLDSLQDKNKRSEKLLNQVCMEWYDNDGEIPLFVLEKIEQELKMEDKKPEPSELKRWQKDLLSDYNQKRFLELIERYNRYLSGVWDSDFTIKGNILLEIISLGWGACFKLDQLEAENKRLRELIGIYVKGANLKDETQALKEKKDD